MFTLDIEAIPLTGRLPRGCDHIRTLKEIAIGYNTKMLLVSGPGREDIEIVSLGDIINRPVGMPISTSRREFDFAEIERKLLTLYTDMEHPVTEHKLGAMGLATGQQPA